MTTTYKYFSLTTSNSGLSKRFRVRDGGYKIVRDKKQGAATTLDGTMDISQGGIYKAYQFTIWVYDVDPTGDGNWGTLADLHTFHDLNNPNGTPSDKLTMVDHYGDSCTVVFMGSLDETPVTVILSGENAIYFFQVVLQKVD